MRKIKFRAWDKENKKMVYSDEVFPSSYYKFEFDCFNDYEFKLMKMIDRYNVIDDEGNETYQEVFKSVDADIMQYTGMKDADGKEVYEGDIIKIISENVITGWDDVGIIVYDEEYGSYCLEGFDGAYMDEYWDVNNLVIKADMYVIGNKYENKEILKEYDFDI